MPEIKDSNIFFKDIRSNLLKPNEKEITKNRSSRSAKLRYVTRNSEEFFKPKELLLKFKNYLDLEAIYV